MSGTVDELKCCRPQLPADVVVGGTDPPRGAAPPLPLEKGVKCQRPREDQRSVVIARFLFSLGYRRRRHQVQRALSIFSCASASVEVGMYRWPFSSASTYLSRSSFVGEVEDEGMLEGRSDLGPHVAERLGDAGKRQAAPASEMRPSAVSMVLRSV